MRASIFVLVVVVACAKSNNRVKSDGGSCAVCTMDQPRCSPDTNTCVGCVGDSDCTAYAQAPHCASSGACVACADSSQCANPTPVCDPTGHDCRTCAADTECASLACNLDDGTCMDPATLIYASPAGTNTAGGTMTDPVSLGRAFDLADATHTQVKLLPGTYTSVAVITLGQPGTDLTVYGSPTAMIATTLQAANGALLHLHDVVFSSGGADCQPVIANGPMPTLDMKRTTGGVVTASACNLKLSQVELTDPSNQAILVTADGDQMGVNGATANRGSQVTIDRSWLGGGDPAISLLHFSSMTVTNTVFANNGKFYGPLAFDATTKPSSLSFSTIYNSALACPSGAIVVSSRNNIYYNTVTGAPADTVTGSACNHTYDLIKPQTASVPGGATNMVNMDPRFTDAANGNFHLLTGSPAIDTADPTATDMDDYDGTMRPQGARDDVGAFELKP